MGETIACVNQKGGVGKTTTVVNLATYLALGGHRVLVVDLDPQGNCTTGLGVDKPAVDHSVYEVLVDGAALSEVVQPTAIARLSLVPAAASLAGLEVELAPLPARERRLSRALEGGTERYDYILLDCPPSLGLLTVNALTAAASVLIPIQSEYYALEGLSDLIATVKLVREHLNPGLEIRGVVLTMYDPRTRLSADVAGEVRRHLGGAVFETLIPRSVRLSEAPSYGLPVALYAPDSRGGQAYRALAAEFLRRDALTPSVRRQPVPA
ncbi:MAG: AAA family ATPase [Chloroflexota bacterium]|nr:AAA family ATPase [Chloroflexota bacterium]